MREDATACSWCWSANTGDTMDEMANDTEDPALGPPKMASSSENASADAQSRDREKEIRDREEEIRNRIAYARAIEPDAGIPGHVGPDKQLHSGTGYNLLITEDGKIFGTKVPFDNEAVMVVTAREGAEVQIQGKKSKFYVAMDKKGKVYAEQDEYSPNTWFKELYDDGWNFYRWTGNTKEWYLAINKHGKMKPGYKTKKKQKSVKFVPRSATPP